MTTPLTVFVACAPGVEPMLAEELRGLGAVELVPEAGGITVRCDLAFYYRVHLCSGLALKVLLRVGEFRARRFDTLITRVSELPWDAWCAPNRPIAVRAQCKRSKLYHSGAVVERVLSGITQRLGRPLTLAPEDDGVLVVQARLVDDTCTISIDAAGEALHRRGYRKATGKAPLREDLARALLVAAGWDGTGALCDPFAGSGTIAIEADWLARRVPPGHLRTFAFMDTPRFDAKLWQRVRKDALAGVRTSNAPIYASDRDPGAVAALRANAERAGSTLSIAQASMSEAPGLASDHPGELFVVTNPPYGKRIGDSAAVTRLYRALGDRLRDRTHLKLALTVAAPEHAFAVGLPTQPALMTDHGGSKIYFALSDADPLDEHG